MEGQTEGRIVHYQINSSCRAAVIVRSHEPGNANLHVFRDGSNDASLVDPMTHTVLEESGWVTSRQEGAEPGNWHDPRACPFRGGS
ncbi:MAG: hypothetical protein WD556_11545 [Actinomycetota bacterium]